MTETSANILAIDTATEACSVALCLEGNRTSSMEVTPNGHSRLLLGMVQELLDQEGVDLRELDALAVDVGPGSFTGLRIGIGVVQGLAYGAGLNVIPLESLQILAAAVEGDTTVLPAIDARMRQVYYAHYRQGSAGGLLQQLPASLADPGKLEIEGNGLLVGVGSGWDRYADSLQRRLTSFRVDWRKGQFPRAETGVLLAQRAGIGAAISPLQLMASYVRNEVVAGPSV